MRSYGGHSLAFSMILLGGALVAFSGAAQAARNVGNFDCTECGVLVPKPDAATLAFLRSQERKFNSPRPFNFSPQGLKVGDSLVVCNGLVCSEYIWRGDAEFDSGEVISTILPPEAMGPWKRGGGGSDRGPPAGSGIVPIGSPPKPPQRTGTVTVGPPSTPKKTPVRQKDK